MKYLSLAKFVAKDIIFILHIIITISLLYIMNSSILFEMQL